MGASIRGLVVPDKRQHQSSSVRHLDISTGAGGEPGEALTRPMADDLAGAP
jgi:hypothetical protein